MKVPITILQNDDETFGHIELNERIFAVQSLGKNSVLIEYDKEVLAETSCGINGGGEGNTSRKSAENKSPITPTADRANVRVLFLYTTNANNAVASIPNTVHTALAQMNTALYNSAVSGHLTMSLAGIEHLSFTEDPSNIVQDVNELSVNISAQTLRNNHQADLVILLTDGNYGSGSIYGVAADIGPKETDAYATVEADITTAQFTFAHEAGHLFGGLHHNDPNGAYEHGYTFKTGTWPIKDDQNTIMYAWAGDYLLHYSNPNVYYKGEATGVSSFNDVARKLRATAATVEAFRAYTPPFSVSISGPAHGNNDGLYTGRPTPQAAYRHIRIIGHTVMTEIIIHAVSELPKA